MRNLYPEIHPYAHRHLTVAGGHEIYLEESGNPQGLPVLCVHGGPGGGADELLRRFFDPETYRIILFDQRGCGRSRPHGSLEHNTTPDLIEDMERIRTELDIERWLLFGGSWGAALSLLYAEAHPQAVSALILRGVFLCRQRDIDWLYREGANRLFPDHWQHFLEAVDAAPGEDLVHSYYERLTSHNDIERMAAARAWSAWEAACSTLKPNPMLQEHFADPHVSSALARIESHYFIHGGFMRENEILDEVARLAEIPAILVHGRYDAVCPVDQAFALYRALPEAELHIVRDAGHSALEPGITDNLIKATEHFAERLA